MEQAKTEESSEKSKEEIRREKIKKRITELNAELGKLAGSIRDDPYWKDKLPRQPAGFQRFWKRISDKYPEELSNLRINAEVAWYVVMFIGALTFIVLAPPVFNCTVIFVLWNYVLVPGFGLPYISFLQIFAIYAIWRIFFPISNREEVKKA